MVASNKNIPVLRFKEFSDSWNVKKIDTIAEKVNSGKTPLGGESVYTSYGILFIRSQNILDNKLSLKNSTYIPEEVNDGMKNSIVNPLDILLNITGASLGRSCVVPKNFTTGNVNQHVCIIRLNKNNDPYFLQPVLASEKGQNLLTSLQTGSGREGLNFQSIRKLSISFPSLPEQQKIASFLSAVDEKIQQLTRKKELLEQYKKGVMQQLFSGKLRFKDENGKDYPAWEEKRLGTITSLLKDGSHGSHKDYPEGKHYLLSAKNINKGKISVDDSDRRISEDEYKSIYKNYDLRENDILLTIVGTIGRVAIFRSERNIVFQRSVAFFRFKNDVPAYLFQYMNHSKFQMELDKRKVVSAQPGVYLGDLAKIPVLLPCIKEQQKIANYLSSIDTQIETFTTKITQTQTFKKGLLQQMFV